MRGQGLYDMAALDRSRNKLRQSIETWRSIQPLYMPGVAQLRQTQATRIDGMPGSDDAEKPEILPLFLPSAMPSAIRASGCVSGLISKNIRLRVAEANDSLVGLRRQLRIMTGVFNYKKTHVSGTGQGSNTRARTLMSRITEKTQLYAARYRAARHALTQLDPNGSWADTLLPLLAKDVRGPQRRDDNDDPSEGRRELSWIWTHRGAYHAPDGGDEFDADEGKF